MEMNDFTLSDDLETNNGDLRLAEASQQNIAHILLAHKGAYKENPLLGVGIEDYLKGNIAINRLRLEAEIEKQLIHDDFNVGIIDLTDLENITIDGNY
ncbi:MAG: hypothetical protein AAF551_09310 [Bacteroidota bacterium]